MAELEDISAFATNCHGLVSLSIACYGSFDAIPALLAVFKKAPRLHTLKLWSCQCLNDESLRDMVTNCKWLRNLSLGNDKALTDVGMGHIGANCRDLCELSLGCTGITDAGVKSIVLQNPNLKTVSIEDAKISDDCVFAIATSCRKLKSIYIRNAEHMSFTVGSLQYLGEHCKDLQRFHVQDGWELNDESLHAVVQHCSLHDVDVSCCPNVTDAFLHDLSLHCKTLLV